MQKMQNMIILSILSFINLAQAEDVDFKFIYSPKYIKSCTSVSDSNVYLQRSKKRLTFKILMDMSSKDAKKIVHDAESYSFKIYSHKGTKLVTPDNKPLKRVKFSDFLDDAVRNHSVIGYSLGLKVPSKIRKSARVDKDGIKFNSWNILAVLQNDTTGKVIGLSTYNLQFLPSGLAFYEKIDDTSRFYSLNAVPDSVIYDNTLNMETLNVDKYIENTISESDENENLKGYGFGFDLDSNFDFSIVDSYYYSFFNQNYHSYKPVIDDIGIAFSAFDFSTDTDIVTIEKSHSVLNHFEVLPGSSGVIYEQAHIEDADYIKYGANECGFLSNLGTERKSVVRYSYDMITVDRTRYLEEGYLEELGKKVLPIYDFR